METPGYWMGAVAMFSAIGALATAVGTALAAYFNTKPKLDALEYKLRLVQEQLDECRRKHLDTENKYAKLQDMLLDVVKPQSRGGIPPSEFIA